MMKEPNKVWVSDTTFVTTEEGWLYVSVSLDLFSRKIVGLSMGTSLGTPLVLKTLNQVTQRLLIISSGNNARTWIDYPHYQYNLTSGCLEKTINYRDRWITVSSKF